MKKINTIITFIIFVGIVATTSITVDAKPMPENKIPVIVKVEGSGFNPINTLNGYNIDGYNYVKARDLAKSNRHFNFSWNDDKKLVEFVDEYNNVTLFTNKDLEDLGALQYNNENYFKVRTLLELGLANPQIKYDVNTKVISWNNEDTSDEALINTADKIYAIDNGDYSNETKEYMYRRIYHDLPGYHEVLILMLDEENEKVAYIEDNNIGELWALAYGNMYKSGLAEVEKLMEMDKLAAGYKLFELNQEQRYRYRPQLEDEVKNEVEQLEEELKDYMPISLFDVYFFGQYSDYEYFKDTVKVGYATPGDAAIEEPYQIKMDGGSSVTININNQVKRFVGNVDSKGLKVYGDGKLLYISTTDSTSIYSDDVEKFNIDISGVKKLKIENSTNETITLDEALLLRHNVKPFTYFR